MTTDVQNKISLWLQDKLNEANFPDDVIAINFGIQKVLDGYEIYQQGCNDFYKDHDTWLQSEIYSPADNFLNLGKSSLDIRQDEIFEYYKSEVVKLRKRQTSGGHVKHVTITYFNGRPEDILTNANI